ncbi:MAG: hypothetical protein IT244_04140 [Bacteroidia bacterium]|nr:hypothetical protein [Bacteroidia bacterium]
MAIWVLLMTGCTPNNHVDKHNVQVSELLILPDYMFGNESSSVHLMGDYSKWTFKKDKNGNVAYVQYFENLPPPDTLENKPIEVNLHLDSNKYKKIAQKFVVVTDKYKIKYIEIDSKQKISFSTGDIQKLEYVYLLNPELMNAFLYSKDYKFLNNKWFQRR